MAPFASEVALLHFTDPTTGNQTHTDVIKQLVDAAQPDDTIHLVASHFKDTTVAEVIAEAAKRGVKVYAIVRREGSNDAVRTTLQAAGLQQLIICEGCFGTKIHTKLLLFSATSLAGARITDIAVAGSWNLTTGSKGQHQNLFAISDSKLYQALLAHWDEMAARPNDGDTLPAKPDPIDLFSSSALIKTYLFPRNVLFSGGSDPVVNIINNVTAYSSFLDTERPVIRVAMARWSRLAIFWAIARALGRGCKLDLVLRGPSDDGVKGAIFVLLLTLLVLYSSRLSIRRAIIGSANTDVHSKYVLVYGRYDGSSSRQKIVWTGSHNWTEAGLKSNDELMMKFRDAHLFDLFAQNHSRLKQLCQTWP